MQNAARAYGAIAKQIANPRELEADLLLRAASRLQAVQETWASGNADLDDALLYNRRLWSIFLTAVTDEASQLPPEIRQNVANLGLFVMKQTLSIMSDPQPERLSHLIKINREIAAGLNARA
jgi:flagellar protein FlaF